MKKLIVLLLLMLPLSVLAQRVYYDGEINAGASDTVVYETETINDNFFGGVWSYQLDYRGFDDVDATIGLYYSIEHPDSGTYVLLPFDENLDGTNDNPWTLSDTANGDFVKHGWFFPGKYFIRVLTRGSISDSTAGYEFIIKQ
jgi:hypothetical protein